MTLAISKIRKTVFRLLFAFERVYAYAISKIRKSQKTHLLIISNPTTAKPNTPHGAKSL